MRTIHAEQRLNAFQQGLQVVGLVRSYKVYWTPQVHCIGEQYIMSPGACVTELFLYIVSNWCVYTYMYIYEYVYSTHIYSLLDE